MAFFDKLGNTISAAGKTGLSKAKEIKDTAKITLDIQEREGAIRKLYRILDRLTIMPIKMMRIRNTSRLKKSKPLLKKLEN